MTLNDTTLFKDLLHFINTDFKKPWFQLFKLMSPSAINQRVKRDILSREKTMSFTYIYDTLTFSVSLPLTFWVHFIHSTHSINTYYVVIITLSTVYTVVSQRKKM